jgi:excisionase family DNA binding protein
MNDSLHHEADRPPEAVVLSFQDLRDWLAGEIGRLVEQTRQSTPAYLSIKQAARMTCLSETRIRQAILRHEMAARNIGSEQRPVYRIARSDLDKWLEGRKSCGPSLARAELRALVEKLLPGLFKKSS